MVKYTYIILFLVFTSLILKSQVTTQTLTSSSSFVVPCAVTSITVQCWGGGGAGGGATGNPAGGAGGAGGAYSYSVIGVTPGQSITYTVGGGGNGGTGNGPSGGNTTFSGVVASGGAGGAVATANSSSAIGPLGSSAGSVGSIIFAGGNGGTGLLGNSAGGGGGGAGTTANGGNGGVTSAGAGGTTGGGAGGVGGATGGNGTNGNNGTIPGGGGGGGRAGNNTAREGGNGARGQIVISYAGVITANAGADQTINTCLTTTASVSGNTVATTTGSWTCVSTCGGITVVTPSSANTSITNILPGTSPVFRWTLTSTTSSCSVSDDVQITISTTPHFTANAGADQTITSCTSTSASVSGNTVAATTGSWTCISGCGGISITSPTLATTTVTNLSPNNVYILRWTLKSTITGCSSLDNVQIIINCTATNDNPCSATPITVNSAAICSVTADGTVFGATASTLSNTCVGSADDDVWFSFVANSTSQDISLLNIAGNTTDLNHAVYTGTACGTFTSSTIICSDPNNSTVTTTVGATYYIRVYSSIATTGRNTVFDICVKPTPPPPTNTSCATQQPICSDTPISFQAQSSGGDAAVGPDYGCLSTTPNPTWFYLQIANSGLIAIDITANADIDFALWGPYPSLSAAQASCTSYPMPTDCSYSDSNVEQANATSAVSGQVYVLLVTNYAGIVQTIDLKSSGTSVGSTNCNIVPSPLPIELVSFEATLTEGKQVLLNWITSTEKNNDYFEIQRSDDAYNWTVIGIQKGLGNSVILKNYQFTDKEPYSSISYYRLKQIDFDKTFTYSKVVSVDMASLPESISNLHPNPTKDIVNFNWKASKKGNIIIELLDYKGETVYSDLKQVEEGINSLMLDVGEYKNGIYLLKITSQSNGKNSVYKILKL